MKHITLTVVLFSSILFSSHAQDGKTKFRTIGGITGYGYTLNPDLKYKIFFIAGDFSWSFKATEKKMFLSWYAEPQFNMVHTDRPLDIEFGANLGLRNYIRINDGFLIYQMIGSGPHYISAVVERQATGFIFSDNFALGAFKMINKKNLALHFQLRFRHISNAGLKEPNKGIDSFNFLIGLSSIR